MSENTIHPADSLKSIDQVLVPDPRYNGVELTDWHSRVADITLVETTPKEVKQLFENAKNIALYAYFAYRLHQPAEAIGYTALEKAFKLKFGKRHAKHTFHLTSKLTFQGNRAVRVSSSLPLLNTLRT